MGVLIVASYNIQQRFLRLRKCIVKEVKIADACLPPVPDHMNDRCLITWREVRLNEEKLI